jgi:hypothetical protein
MMWLWDKVRHYVTVIWVESWRALLTAALAAIGAFIGSVYADIQRTETFSTTLTETGVGYPSILFFEAQSENENLAIEFIPPQLSRIGVCEYYTDKQQSFRTILDRYLERYSACMIPLWRAPDYLQIRPNPYTGRLIETVGADGDARYWCNCAPDQIPSG